MASERTSSPSGAMGGSICPSLESGSNAVDVLLPYKYIVEKRRHNDVEAQPVWRPHALQLTIF